MYMASVSQRFLPTLVIQYINKR